MTILRIPRFGGARRDADAGAAAAPGGGLGTRDETYLQRTFKSLSHRNYRYLWLGMLFMMAGMNMQMVARGQLAWELSRSELLTTVVGAGFAVPVLLLSLYGGAVADRVERKKLVQFGQIANAANSLWITVAIFTHTVTVWHLLSASVIQGFIWAFLMPARQSLISQIVGKDLLGNAVALNASGMSLMTLVAPAISGVIYAKMGPGEAYAAITVTAAAAVLFTSMISKLPPGTVSKVRKNVVADMKEGLRYITSNKTVLWLLFLTLGTSLLSMPFRQLFPVYADKVFGHGADSVGLMLTVIGGGALVGTLIIAGLKSSQGRGFILIMTAVLSGIGMIAAAFITSYPLAIVNLVLPGLGEAGRRSLSAALVMEQTEERYQGRVMGVYMMNFGLIPLGALPMGAVAEVLSVQAAFAGAGVLLIVVAIVSIFGTPRIRRL